MPLTIRPAVPEDVAAIAAVGRASFVHAFEHLFTPGVLDRYLEATYSPAKIAESLADPENCYFVAETADGVVGFLKLKADSAHPSVGGSHPWQVQKLYVDPAHVGHGMGGQLMVVGEGVMRQAGTDVAWLVVHEDNTGAMRFYERLGYRDVGEHSYDFEDLTMPFRIFEKRYA